MNLSHEGQGPRFTSTPRGIYRHESARISFEFFPPKNIESTFRLSDTVRDLAPLDPSFVSVTYGAGARRAN